MNKDVYIKALLEIVGVKVLTGRMLFLTSSRRIRLRNMHIVDLKRQNLWSLLVCLWQIMVIL